MRDPIKANNGQPIRIGDYDIHGLIAEGGMARVYRGEEVLSHRKVAVKVLRAELVHSEQVRRKFLNEMRILASLDHPNIVRCLLCTEYEGRPVMVLELLEGLTLREMLGVRGALHWPEMARYAVQIAKALEAAHARIPSVVHRDLKPENVIIQPDGRVKVMDFGIAKIVQAVSGTTDHAVGTLQYMSPEHIDARTVDGRADLFALGLLMWEMLAGQPPFTGKSPRELLDKICNHPTPRLPDQARAGLPPHLEALIDALLAKEPAARPVNASEVIRQIEPWTKTGSASPAPPPREQARPQAAPRPQARPQASAPLNTHELVDVARKGPLQQQVEQQFDEVADAVSRFGRATSALIVRVLVSLMILPAAAVMFVGIPAMFAFTVLSRLAEEQDVLMVESDFEKWVMPELVPVLLLAAVVFVRSCWVHHREPSETPILKLWLIFGAVLAIAWGSVMALEFAPDSKIPTPVHYATCASLSIWLTLTLSWATGRIASLILARLERARVPA
jgi:tRNA A-37 threonylcarbamoyl transferase component Bud32